MQLFHDRGEFNFIWVFSWKKKIPRVWESNRSLTVTIASQVAPSACLSRLAPPTKDKTCMRIQIVPLVPEVESQPAAPKKHWTPNHQLEIRHKFGWVKSFAIGLWLGQHFKFPNCHSPLKNIYKWILTNNLGKLSRGNTKSTSFPTTKRCSYCRRFRNRDKSVDLQISLA